MYRNAVKFSILAIILLSLLCLFTACSSGENSNTGSLQDMTGVWYGSGEHTMGDEFLSQKQIPFELIIAKDGTMSGRIGDADIVKSTLVKSPIYLRILGSEKYRTKFDLIGNIVRDESFYRNGGKIYFKTISPTELVCSFKSSGSDVKAQNLVLPINEIVFSHNPMSGN